MRLRILSVFALIGVTACAVPATPTLAPPPTVASTVAPSIPAPSSGPATTGQSTCNATYQVPGNEFRSDDPAKLDAGNRPKLVEFFAVW